MAVDSYHIVLRPPSGSVVTFTVQLYFNDPDLSVYRPARALQGPPVITFYLSKV